MKPEVLAVIHAAILHIAQLARELQGIFALQRDPTPEELAKLTALISKSYDQHIAEARARAGGQS